MDIEPTAWDWTDIDFIDGDLKPVPMAESDPWGSTESHSNREVRASSPIGFEDFDPTEHDSWGVEDLAEEEPEDPWSDTPAWAEPEPTVDASSELGESLYPPDNTITDLSRELNIDELLNAAIPSTENQRARCYELLCTFSTRRLRYLIPWLRKRAWCGTKLLLFLDFRVLWELPRNMRWWENFCWSDHQEVWIPRYISSTLTLDHAGELVERRRQRALEDIIDRTWLEDWDDSAAWEAGIRSFASFAVFRAGVPEGQDWRELLFPRDQRSILEVKQCEDDTYAPFMLPSLVRQYKCPRMLSSTTELWKDITDLAHRNAATLGDDRTRAWQETMAHYFSYRT